MEIPTVQSKNKRAIIRTTSHNGLLVFSVLGICSEKRRPTFWISASPWESKEINGDSQQSSQKRERQKNPPSFWRSWQQTKFEMRRRRLTIWMSHLPRTSWRRIELWARRSRALLKNPSWPYPPTPGVPQRRWKTAGTATRSNRCAAPPFCSGTFHCQPPAIKSNNSKQTNPDWNCWWLDYLSVGRNRIGIELRRDGDLNGSDLAGQSVLAGSLHDTFHLNGQLRAQRQRHRFTRSRLWRYGQLSKKNQSIINSYKQLQTVINSYRQPNQVSAQLSHSTAWNRYINRYINSLRQFEIWIIQSSPSRSHHLNELKKKKNSVELFARRCTLMVVFCRVWNRYLGKHSGVSISIFRQSMMQPTFWNKTKSIKIDSEFSLNYLKNFTKWLISFKSGWSSLKWRAAVAIWEQRDAMLHRATCWPWVLVFSSTTLKMSSSVIVPCWAVLNDVSSIICASSNAICCCLHCPFFQKKLYYYQIGL